MPSMARLLPNRYRSCGLLGKTGIETIADGSAKTRRREIRFHRRTNRSSEDTAVRMEQDCNILVEYDAAQVTEEQHY